MPPSQKPAPNIDLWLPTPGEIADGVELSVELAPEQTPIILHLRSLRHFTVVRQWFDAMSQKKPKKKDDSSGLVEDQVRTICAVLLVKITGFTDASGAPVEVVSNDESIERICSFLLRAPTALNAVNNYITETLGIGSASDTEEMVGKSETGSGHSTNSPTPTSEH